MSREIIDSAIVQQFKKYLKTKNKVLEELQENEMKEESVKFLEQYYPGAESPPHKMVELMASPDTDKSLKSLALVNPEEDKTCNIFSYGGNGSVSSCPDSSWIQNTLGDCIKFFNTNATRPDAAATCNSISLNGNAARLLRFVDANRAEVIWCDLNDNRFPDYDLQRFWIEAIKTSCNNGVCNPGPNDVPPDGIIWEADSSPVNISGVFNEVFPKYNDNHLNANPQTEQGKYRLNQSKNPQVFFCIFEGAVTPATMSPSSSCNTTTEVSFINYQTIPVLPKFPCFDSGTINRKRRAVTSTTDIENENETDQLTKSIEKLNLLLDPAKELERQSKMNESQEDFKNRYGSMDLMSTYSNLFEILWYSQMPCFDVKNVTSDAPDQMSMIKQCYWKGKEISCSSIFQTLPTDRGMCCSFNMERAEEIFKTSTYANLAKTMHDQDTSNRYLPSRQL